MNLKELNLGFARESWEEGNTKFWGGTTRHQRRGLGSSCTGGGHNEKREAIDWTVGTPKKITGERIIRTPKKTTNPKETLRTLPRRRKAMGIHLGKGLRGCGKKRTPFNIVWGLRPGTLIGGAERGSRRKKLCFGKKTGEKCQLNISKANPAGGILRGRRCLKRKRNRWVAGHRKKEEKKRPVI